MKILLVGSFSAWSADRRISGTVISLDILVKELLKRGIDVISVDSGDIRKSQTFFLPELFKVWWRMFLCAKKADLIALHLSPTGFSILGPIAIFISRILRKPIIFRLFGGMDYEELPWFRRRLAGWSFSRANRVLLQSKSLVDAAKDRGLGSVFWFPTSRKMEPLGAANPHDPCGHRFVYVGQIKKRKGIFHLIEVAKRLGDRFPLDVFGPFYDSLDEKIFEEVPNLTYGGSLPPEDVQEVLRKAKALIFPTFLREEGYSGILIEAFSVGLPVICTHWKFLPEFVPRAAAVFCAPDDADSLEASVIEFLNNPERHSRMSDASFINRLTFSSQLLADDFIGHCQNLVQKYKKSRWRKE